MLYNPFHRRITETFLQFFWTIITLVLALWPRWQRPPLALQRPLHSSPLGPDAISESLSQQHSREQSLGSETRDLSSMLESLIICSRSSSKMLRAQVENGHLFRSVFISVLLFSQTRHRLPLWIKHPCNPKGTFHFPIDSCTTQGSFHLFFSAVIPSAPGGKGHLVHLDTLSI